MSKVEIKPYELEPCNKECRVKYEVKHGKQVQCGCGLNHKMEPFSTQIVHHFGQHWLLECLTKHLIARRNEDSNAIRVVTNRMQKHKGNIAKLQCAGLNCTAQVGRNYRMIGTEVFCNNCSYDMGGQG